MCCKIMFLERNRKRMEKMAEFKKSSGWNQSSLSGNSAIMSGNTF